MAKMKVVMPQMGESITTGTIVKWNKAKGDIVALDEILLEISTDKVESEIPSPFKGKLENIFFPEGATVDVGVVIAEIETDLSAKSITVEENAPQEVIKTAPIENKDQKRFYTPLVKSMAKEKGIPLSELSQLSGTGAGGRVNRKDLEDFLSKKPQEPVVKVAPVTLPSSKVEIVPMNNMRKVIAKNMVLSKTTSPHVNSIAQVDLTHLVKFRESIKEDFKRDEGFNLTYTHFVMFALVKALREFPTVNASIEGDNIVLKKYINIGFAVATEEGLVVPVVKNADSLNMLGLARAVNDLAEKARTKKLTMDDLSGGTFTFTNNGSFGVLLATPIILQPQVAIYCAGLIQKQLVVMDDDNIAIRSIMYGTHTYDHRLIDGAVGGNFLARVHNILQEMDPAALF